jgi:hypothetical protein
MFKYIRSRNRSGNDNEFNKLELKEFLNDF